MTTDCRAEQLEFKVGGGHRVIADFEGGAMTSDAGALLLRHADRSIKLIDRVAGCFVDHRSPDFIIHGLPALVGQRIVGIALGYGYLCATSRRSLLWSTARRESTGDVSRKSSEKVPKSL